MLKTVIKRENKEEYFHHDHTWNNNNHYWNYVPAQCLLHSIMAPGEAVAVLNQALQLDRKMEEHFFLIAMRSKKVIRIFKVNVGTINNSLVNTDGIFTRLLLCGATHFIIAHNHPSGNVSSSPEDEKVTENIQKISEMMGIVFCDHIIIGSGYFSFLEQNMM